MSMVHITDYIEGKEREPFKIAYRARFKSSRLDRGGGADMGARTRLSPYLPSIRIPY